MNLVKIHLGRILLTILVLGMNQQAIHTQKQCEVYPDFFLNLNKYNPQFDCPAYTTPPIRVDQVEKLNLIQFTISDKDNVNNTRFTFTTNDPNFFVDGVIGETNQFKFNFRGEVKYFINNAHRYEVLVTVSDNGFPARRSSALFIVPLINYNVHAPQYSSPVIISAAITLKPGSFLANLNAWDIDGDSVDYELSSENDPEVTRTLALKRNGTLELKGTLAAFLDSTVDFKVKLTDDGASCGQNGPLIIKSSVMQVTLKIIEVNMHSPEFINNNNNENYCKTVFRVPENTEFEIEITATDLDERSQNGVIMIQSPEMSDRSPQNSFLIRSMPQLGRERNAIVKNKETFDYENPKYGSNTMNIMFYAEDNGVTKRRGYCFMTIEIEDVNDNIPIFAQTTYTIYVHEHYKTRQFNYQFVAIDRDSGLNGQVQYFIETASPYNNDLVNNLFSLSLDGTLSIANVSCLDQLKGTEVFYIYATDLSPERNRSALTTVRVINDNLKILPPFFLDFPDPPVIDNVSEMISRGQLLRNFTVLIQTDPTNQFLRCFLSPKPNPEWFKFEFPPKDAGAKLAKRELCELRVEDPLNYRVGKEMIVYMVAEIGNYEQPSTARELKILTIKLKEENINSPKFVTSTIDASVVEGTSDLGKVIAVVKAYDLDITSPFNKITYEFDRRSNTDNHFIIDPNTGEIKLNLPIKNKKNIPLTVIAKDGANGYNKNTPNQNTIYVDVKVIDINDNPPVFSPATYEFEVSESEQPGFVIGTVEITDDDSETAPTYSITDSTFGIRKVADTASSRRDYRESAEIYLNNYLDFKRKNIYDLEVIVSDSEFVSRAKLTIRIRNVNDRAPEFLNLPYEVTIKEMTSSPNNPIVTLAARDDDALSNEFLFEMYSTSYLNVFEHFNLNPKTGQLYLKNGLDRDLPFGRPVYNIPVSVKDMGGKVGESLTTFTKVKITLEDLNDNPPYLAYAPGFRPLVIEENIPNLFVEIYVVDNDEPKNGPPFTFTLDTFTDIFQVSSPQACILCKGNEVKYRIFNLKAVNYDVQRSYEIAYTLRDNSNNENKGVLQILVGDIDNNEHTGASKIIELVTFNKNLQGNSFLGTLYTKDGDTSDLETKKGTNCSQTPSQFSSLQGVSIYGPLGSTNFFDPIDSDFGLQCYVTDARPIKVTARVDFTLTNVDNRDIQDLTGIRMFGITAKEFTNKLDVSDSSYLNKFMTNLQAILGNAIVQIVTIKDYEYINPGLSPNQIPSYDPATQFATDVYFYAIKDTKHISSRQIYNTIFNNLNQLESILPGNFKVELLFDKCIQDSVCPEQNTTCKQSFLISRQPLTVDANAAGFVGMDNSLSTECYCDVSSGSVAQNFCYNGGTLVQSDSQALDYYCQCPKDFNGPRCEFLNIQFRFKASSHSHSYALFDKFTLCDPIRIEFEFSTDRDKGLILFNGPINRDTKYFLAVEIVDKNLLVHLGDTTLKFPDVQVSDKEWHQVTISMSLDAIQATLDKCVMQQATIDADLYAQMLADKQQTDDVKLSLGGIPQSISTNHFYYKLLNVFEYEGCIRNLRVNGDLRDLKLQESFNQAENTVVCDCKYSTECNGILLPIGAGRNTEFPWWIILIIIAALIMLAGIMGIALCSVKRKDNLKKMLQMFPDDDIRETIINYADGAGEENTENFNIGVMKKPVTTTLLRSQQLKSPVTEVTNDQNMIYAYEGEGSDAGSLSSVDSFMAHDDQEFDYLQDWGPKFQKLSNMYRSTEDIQTYQTYK